MNISPDTSRPGLTETDNEILPNLLKLNNKQKINEQEFKGFFRAQTVLIEDLTDRTRFTIPYIMNIHREALKHLYPFAGKLRTTPVSKPGFHVPALKILQESMASLDTDLLKAVPDRYFGKEMLLKDVARIHAVLQYIHPFKTGNGRVARLLANLMMLKSGYKYLELEEVIARKPKEYVAAIQVAQHKNYLPMEALIREAFVL
jgi:cell filamentation protein